MNLNEFIEEVIEKGIEAAKADYTKPEDSNRLKGSIEGFEACRGKSPKELKTLLENARKESNSLLFEDKEIEEYWRFNSKTAEIEWVCNCVSAVLVNEGHEPLIPVTCNAVLLANKILLGSKIDKRV
jgi:hypothetical protein